MMSLLDNRPRFWLIAGLSLLFYVLPWVINPGAGLTVGGYDLAEWVSLTPAARSQLPVLIAPFLLRLPLFSLTALTAVHISAPMFTYRWWGNAIFMFLLILAQIPPLEFLSHTDDINNRQQALLAGLSLLLALAGLSGLLRRYRGYMTGLITAVTCFAAGVGLWQAQDIMRQYHLPADTGFGGVGFIALYGLAAITSGLMVVKANRAAG